MTNFWTGKRVLITGATGFVGSHLCAELEQQNLDVLFAPASFNFDLRKSYDIQCMFEHWQPLEFDLLINLAANVGGIGYNQNHPYSLFYDNIQIGVNLIHAAIAYKVKKFVQIGTVCAYPKFTPIPFDERCLWDGYPEETNAPYGIAKRVTLTQLQAARQEFGFNGIYILPTNLYGIGDNFNEEQSHVIPALIKKFVEAKQQNLPQVEVWGTGNASRDFLYTKDAISGIMLLAEKYDSAEPVNLGNGNEVKISVLAHYIKEITGYEGSIVWDKSKPDGQPRRGLRIWKAKELGWTPQTNLKDGLKETIDWYLANN
jgi:GDP-L-fucose synthase